MKTQINVTCPNCGTDINISATTNSCNKKVIERIQALKKAGYDVSSYRAVIDFDGDVKLGKVHESTFKIVDSDDVLRSIIAGGTIPNRKLFRRWVMAQMFRHLTAKNVYGKAISVSQSIRKLGYEYQWRMLEDEFNAQEHMKRNGDYCNLASRNLWFNREVVLNMMKDYMKMLEAHISMLPTKKCKGISYKHIGSRDFFEQDIRPKVLFPLYRLIDDLEMQGDANLYAFVEQFNRKRVKFGNKTPQHKVWLDAYKGAGAYFTMQNLIRFHEARIIENGECLNEENSIHAIDRYATTYHKGEGWRMIGILKEMLQYNHISVEDKIKEWRKH